jgi:hypothetical protein
VKALRGWLALAFALALFELALDHARFRAVEQSMDAGTFRLTPSSALDAVRAYLTNDGDVRRYQAYVEAARGRPYPSFYVRSAEAWRAAFARGENARPESFPIVAPAAPLVPYRDFLVEYPPGFFLVALPPAWIAAGQHGYLVAFCALMALLLAAAVAIAERLARRLGGALAPGQLPAFAALAVIGLGVVATHRYDAAVGLALAAAGFAFAARRPIPLGLALGAAAALKGVPALVALYFAVAMARDRRWRELAVAAAIALALLAATLVPAARLAGGALSELLRYHADRPLQIESTWAALLALVARGSVAVARTFGSTNLVGGPTRFVAPLAAAGPVAAAVALAAWLWRALGRFPDGEEGDARRVRATLAAACAALAAFMALGKVFSPQYLGWLLPLGALLSLLDGRRRARLLFLGVMAATQLVYPIGYGALEALLPWACALVLVRNGLALAWAATLLDGAW